MEYLAPPGFGKYHNSRITISITINTLVDKLNHINSDLSGLSTELTNLTNKTRDMTLNSKDSTEIEKTANNYVKLYNNKIDTFIRNHSFQIQDIYKLINRLKLATAVTTINKPIIIDNVPQDDNFRVEKGFGKCADKDIYTILLTIGKNFSNIKNLNESKLNIKIADKVNRARKALNGLLSKLHIAKFAEQNKYDFSFIALLFTIIIDLGILILTILINTNKKNKDIEAFAKKLCENKKDVNDVKKILNNLMVGRYIILPEEDGFYDIEFKDGYKLEHGRFITLINLISDINNSINPHPVNKLPNIDISHIESNCYFENNVKYRGYKINNMYTINKINRLIAKC